MEGFRRHDLVWLDPDADMAALLGDDEHAEIASSWIRQNWPLVVARQPDEAARQAGYMQLGITLPSAPARSRVSLRVPHTAIITYSRPLLLKDAIAYAPQAWRDQLVAVSEICEVNTVVARVYGSLSTQAFTSQNYVDESSDVDVLFECSKDTQLRKLFDGLQALAEQTPRLDGEVIATSGWAVAWRELAAALSAGTQGKVLAKSYNETRLIAIDQLFEHPNGHGK